MLYKLTYSDLTRDLQFLHESFQVQGQDHENGFTFYFEVLLVGVGGRETNELNLATFELF